ncbi:tetratricopeptide repeat protein [Sandaracinus amylolyticus]|uniref:tetratricopeptide repeat protein n=1 Tax=Sandaracinus amylolyticus TaxID=927083 RepID=UPI001F3CA740|nr:hypothetical protein [Sandaracinus amylolyticus]UJR84898.1 Hypothetical protein I5071_69770 [Sandaracinus amylolyticus]
MTRVLLIVVALAAIGCGGAQTQPDETPVTDPLSTVQAGELYERGVYLAQHEDYIRAEQYLVAAMQRGHDEHVVMPALLAACVRSSRLSAALGYAEPYLERHPDAWSLRLLVATIHMGLGEAENAHTHLLRVVEEHPDEAVAHYMLGVLSRDDLANPAAAIASFQRYLELAPEGEHAPEARASIVRASSAPPPSAEGAALPVRMPSHHQDDAPAAQPSSGATQ